MGSKHTASRTLRVSTDADSQVVRYGVGLLFFLAFNPAIESKQILLMAPAFRYPREGVHDSEMERLGYRSALHRNRSMFVPKILVIVVF